MCSSDLNAYWVTNGSATITSGNITGLSSYSAKTVTLNLASFSIASTTNGADATDYVRLGVSVDGGATFSDEIEVNGGTLGNAHWGFASGTGVATVTYDGNNAATVFAPAGGGARTTDGYSLLQLNLPSSVTQLIVRISMLNSSANEGWIVDDLNIYSDLGAITWAWASTPAGFSSTSQNPTSVAVSASTT